MQIILVKFSKMLVTSHYQVLQNVLSWEVSVAFGLTAVKLWLIEIQDIFMGNYELQCYRETLSQSNPGKLKMV